MPAKAVPTKKTPVEATEPQKKLTAIEVVETLANPSRWRLLQALKEPMTAPELAKETGFAVANVFFHMRKLVHARVVKLVIGKDGAYVFHPKDFRIEVVADEAACSVRFQSKILGK